MTQRGLDEWCVCVYGRGIYACEHIHICVKTPCRKNYKRNMCMGEIEKADNKLVAIGKGKRPLGIGRCT
jgi:hypothetical protein